MLWPNTLYMKNACFLSIGKPTFDLFEKKKPTFDLIVLFLTLLVNILIKFDSYECKIDSFVGIMWEIWEAITKSKAEKVYFLNFCYVYWKQKPLNPI